MLRTPVVVIFFSVITAIVTAAPNSRIVRDQVPKLQEAADIDTRALIPLNPRPVPSVTPTPSPSQGRYPLQYALDNGWSVAVHVWSYVYPVSSSAPSFEKLLTQIQAYALARMLQDLPAPCRLRMNLGDNLNFAIGMAPGSTMMNLDWAVVYGFAQYMLQWVRSGFVGQGGMLFRHRSGILLKVALVNGDSKPGDQENMVTPNSC